MFVCVFAKNSRKEKPICNRLGREHGKVKTPENFLSSRPRDGFSSKTKDSKRTAPETTFISFEEEKTQRPQSQETVLGSILGEVDI
jgi:hypothetical protein